jgi:DNA polymerase-3 subunit gamma/tau
MSYQVLARKWRPRSFETLVGQEHVVRALTHALEQQRLHHAYLFTGTRGVGKTTIARILAKALNCETGITSKPCGVCSACQEIDSRPLRGPHRGRRRHQHQGRRDAPAAGERRLRADARPLQGVRHRRSAHAVHLGLQRHAEDAGGTARAHQVHPRHHRPAEDPGDGAQRCLQFNLKQMPQGHIVEHLSRVLEAEQVPFEPAALRHIAKGAAGSMRDALSLLDQAIAHGAGRVEEAGVRDMLGTVGEDHLFACSMRWPRATCRPC